VWYPGSRRFSVDPLVGRLAQAWRGTPKTLDGALGERRAASPRPRSAPRHPAQASGENAWPSRLAHHLQQLPRTRRGDDLLDRLPRELPVADGEVPVQPDLLRPCPAPAETARPKRSFSFSAWPSVSLQPEAQVVGQVPPAHRHDARRVRRRRPGTARSRSCPAPRSIASTPCWRSSGLVTMCPEARLARTSSLDLEVEAADHVQVVRQPLLLPVHRPVAHLEASGPPGSPATSAPAARRPGTAGGC
jgi:hypothetical protein